MELTSAERETVRSALPEALRGPTHRGGIAGLMVEHEGRLLDAAVRLAPPFDAWARPLPSNDPAALRRWLTLIERRRGQLAHELSGPATGVLAAVETVIEYEPVPASSRQLLSDARAGMMRLTRLLDDRATVLATQSNAVAAPLGHLARRWAESVREKLDPLGERMALTVRADPREVRCDAVLGAGALEVLIGNAWRFREDQHVSVEVEAHADAQGLRWTVSDDGRGISDDTFERAGELGFSTRASGVGLGLFLVRWAARRHGGAVVLERRARGTRATVFIPTNT